MRAYHCSIRTIPQPVDPDIEMGQDVVQREHLGALRGRTWAPGTVLGTAFVDGASAELRKRILGHLNAWSKTANISFRESKDSPQIRIARAGGAQWGGYWSYLGLDNLDVPANEPTMNLEGFTTRTPESEFTRVVRHEAGHALGFPHEHSRREVVAKLDPAKVIAHFQKYEGWSEAMIRDQILTPLPQSAFIGTRLPDSRSVMCYWFGGSLTKDGRPIPGGSDITTLDARFAASIYPRRRA